MINKSIQNNNTANSHIATTILLSFVHTFPTFLCVRLALSLCISGFWNESVSSTMLA